MKKIIFGSLCLFLSLSAVECHGDLDPVPTVPVTGVTLSPATATRTAGSTIKLTPTVLPTNATNKKVSWASSNKALATVDAAGNVTILPTASGTVTITVTTADNNKSATCTITITAAATVKVTGITITPSTNVSVEVDKTTTLTATVTPSTAANKNVTWSSLNTDIATVTSSGVVKGVKAGTANIRATAADGSGVTATKSVIVTSSGLTVDIHKIIPPDILKTIEDMGMPIYKGTNPPIDLAGTYLSSPHILVASNVPDEYYSIGHKFIDEYLTLSEQNNTNLTITVATTQGTTTGSGHGAYIVGSGQKFTVFVPMDKVYSGHSFKTIEIFSGTASTTGISNCYNATFMISGGGYTWGLMPNGTGRLLKDGDGFSEKTSGTKSFPITNTSDGSKYQIK